MLSGLVCRPIYFCFITHVFNAVALPNSLPSQYARALPSRDVNKYTEESSHVIARMDPAANAVIAADIPTATQQSQDITLNTNGQNQPGVIPNLNITREEVDCLNLTSGRDNKCWEELQLTTWVKNWIVGHTCYNDEGFSSCFLRQVGWPELDCTGIKIPACIPPPVQENQDPRVWYVAYNIYGKSISQELIQLSYSQILQAINQYFGSWYMAVGGAANLAGLNVDEIVQLINPPDDTNLILNDILIALTGIFAVAPGLGFNVGNMLDKAVEKASDVSKSLRTGLTFVENAIIGFPQIGRFLYPIDTPASSVVQIADLKNQLGTLIDTVQGNLNKTVVSVMADPKEFLAFASQGNFTAAAPSLPDQQQYLLYAFNTYLISTCLSGNNIIGTIAKDTNVQALATNGSQNSINDEFKAAMASCTGYSSQNVCDSWWYSGNHNSTFGLDHFSHHDRNFHDLLETLFQKYTTGQLLFDNAYGCSQNGNHGSNSVAVTVSAAGLNTQCLSQLKILTWNMQCGDISDRLCEFVEEGPQTHWLGDCGSKSFFSVMDEPVYCVPNGYLGPLVNQRKHKLRRDGGA
ncbi:MAG: hypothetical protein Q9166_003673 [cf. Caloplaca sp. 2 TL-2023]